MKQKRAPSKPKETYDSTARTRAIKHLVSHFDSYDGTYIDKRYWEGFRVGLLQAVVAEEGSQSDLQKIVSSEKTIHTKKIWKSDPLQNGILNGRRFALMLLLKIDYKMLQGDWVAPISSSSFAADC